MKYTVQFLLLLCFCAIVSAGCAYRDQMPPEHPLPSRNLVVSGTATGDGTGLAGILIRLEANDRRQEPRTVLTSPDGSYAFSGLSAGSYTLTPSKPGLLFVPATRSINVANADAPNQNFIAAAPLVPMVRVAGGVFVMGSDRWEVEEQPVRTVKLDDFRISPREISQKQWKAVQKINPSFFPGDDHPVEGVSWLEAVDFCNRLSLLEGLQPAFVINGEEVACDFGANGYRLPTEAEWEFACRAATATDTYRGDLGNDTLGCFDEPALNPIAVYCSQSGMHQPVGSKQPNPLGLYDMLGNVAEWCWDWYENYSPLPQMNPAGPQAGTLKVIRGGSAFQETRYLRSAARASRAPGERQSGLGFRVARSAAQ